MLTGNKNADLLILNNLDDRSLFNVCVSNPKDEYLKSLCGNEDFWRNRFIQIFGKKYLFYKSPDRSWKDFYLKIIYYLEKFGLYDQIGKELGPDAEETLLFEKLAEKGKKNSDLINFFTSYVRHASAKKRKQILKGALKSGEPEWIKRFN